MMKFYFLGRTCSHQFPQNI